MELINFEGRDIRTAEEGGETYFSVVDVVDSLVPTNNARRYWSQVKNRNELFDICVQLKMQAADGKYYNTDCATREGLLRIVQSIPSPSVEPFKAWLANAGEQNFQETEDPEQLIDKFYDLYRQRGQNDDWIDARLRSVQTRKELTSRWEEAGVKSSREYAFLTDIINRGTFDLSIKEHKQLKGLASKHNIRDNMSTTELIYIILAEVLAKEISEKTNAIGYDSNENAARQAGELAGDSRKRFEEKTGLKVVNPKNNLWNKLLGK